MLRPLYHLPSDGAPISEWCRPLSASLTTRHPEQYSATANKKSPAYGWLGKRLKKMAKERLRKRRGGR